MTCAEEVPDQPSTARYRRDHRVFVIGEVVARHELGFDLYGISAFVTAGTFEMRKAQYHRAAWVAAAAPVGEPQGGRP